MAEVAVEGLQAQLQAYVNCLELCRVLHKQTDEPSVRVVFVPLIGDLQACTASLARGLRQRGVPPGNIQLNSEGKSHIRAALSTRSLPQRLRVVRGCLADLVAGYGDAADQADPELASLAIETQRILEWWDREMHGLKVVF
jgi:hypothetical protein